MKKTLLYAGCLFAFTALLASCGTTKQAQTAADEYSGEEEGELIAGSESTEIKSKKKNEKSGIQNQKNAVEKFFTFGNADDYIKYDSTTVFAKEITGLSEKNATVVLRTDNLMAGFGSYNSAEYYYVQFDEASRALLKKAAESYFSDFENKRLQRKGKKTWKAYGKVRFMLNWGLISSSTPSNGTGDGYCGYEFIKGSPYFVICNFPFPNDYYEKAGDAVSRESPSVRYYFTRSQLKQLLDLISEEKIAEQINQYRLDYIKSPTEKDSY